jgi:NCAIR mutase (PurE)-related protein
VDVAHLTRLLERVRTGETSIAAALDELRLLPFEDLYDAKLDHHRALRNGFPEVIFCQGKTPEQVARIFSHLASHNDTVLGTRATPEMAAFTLAAVPEATYHELARCLVLERRPRAPRTPGVVVVSAGTADLPVAEEAVLTAGLMGSAVDTIFDVGVAGIHRLLAHLDRVRAARVVVVVAGMEGALASVVGGLVDVPVIAVPTSVGYGASFNGLAALLAMLNSCATGVAVVNIDNGFGAGAYAAMINRQSRDRDSDRDGDGDER